MNNYTVLFVDDELSNLNTFKRLFRKEQLDIFTADSGQQGLELLAKNPIDLVISDMRMPYMNGAIFLQEVKKLYPHTKRIIMSGYSDIEAIEDTINKGGICKFIKKPWNNDELKTAIRNLINLNDYEAPCNIRQLENIIDRQQMEIDSLIMNRLYEEEAKN